MNSIDPAVQAAALDAYQAQFRANWAALEAKDKGEPRMIDTGSCVEAVVAAVTPLIRAQAFTEAADAIQTTRTGGGWENNINIGLHKAELLVRGLGEGTDA